MNYLDNLAEYIRSECGGGPIALYRIYAVLARAKAPNVTNEDVHDAWVAFTLHVRPYHRFIGPYSDLTPGVQAEDTPFRDVINRSGKETKVVKE